MLRLQRAGSVRVNAAARYALIASLTLAAWMPCYGAEEKTAESPEIAVVRKLVGRLWSQPAVAEPASDADATRTLILSVARADDARWQALGDAFPASAIARERLDALASMRPETLARRLDREARYNRFVGVLNAIASAPIGLVQGNAGAAVRVGLTTGRWIAGVGPISTTERRERIARHQAALMHVEMDDAERRQTLDTSHREAELSALQHQVREARVRGYWDEAQWLARQVMRRDKELGAELLAEVHEGAGLMRRRRGLGLAWKNDGAALSRARVAAMWSKPLGSDAPFSSAEFTEEAFRDWLIQRAWRAPMSLDREGWSTVYGVSGGPMGAANTAAALGVDRVIKSVTARFTSEVPADGPVAAWVAASRQPGLSNVQRADALLRAASMRAFGHQDREAWELAQAALALDPSRTEQAEVYRAAAASDVLQRAKELTREDALTIPRPPEERQRMQAALYDGIVRDFPGTDAAQTSAERRATLGDLPPPGWWRAPLASSNLPIAIRVGPAYRDGVASNDEVEFIDVEVATGRAAIRTLDNKVIPLALNSSERDELAAWARRDRERAYLSWRDDRMAPQWLPLRLEGGVGTGGVDAAPQLKRRTLRDPDAHLYKPAR